MTRTDRLPTHDVTEKLVFSKLQFLSDFNLWPGRSELDPDGWLANFRPIERPFAVNILNVFLYFAEPLVNAMFHGSVHSLSAKFAADADGLGEARERWEAFRSKVLFTYVQGENPSPTDSGHLFVRKVRQVLGISDAHIVDPIDALRWLVYDPVLPIVFVDDFLGSGSQMASTWHRKHQLSGTVKASFAQCVASHSFVCYVPLIATQLGLSPDSRAVRGIAGLSGAHN